MTMLKAGTVYRLTDQSRAQLVAQVCAGADCAIFTFIDSIEDSIARPPLFRVVINERDLKRQWTKVGVYALQPQLTEYQAYGDLDTGSPLRFRTYLSDVDHREQISEEEFSKLERLSVWDTWNILDRLEGVKFF